MTTHVSSVSSRTRGSRRWVGLGGLASGLMLAVTALHGIGPVYAQTISVPVQIEDRGDDRLILNHDARLDDVFAQGLDDRQADLLDRLLQLPNGSARLAGMDDILRQAQGIGVDDGALADMLLGIDIRQEDRALETGDDRLAPAVDQQAQPGDVRQEDRGLETGDVRQEDRQQDRALETGDDRLAPAVDQQAQPGDIRQEDRALEVGDDRLTRPAVQQEDRSSGTSGSGKSTGGPSTTSATTSAPASAPASTPARSSGSGSGSTSGGHGGGHDDAGGHH
jgi:hypothetical protein